jgi:parallel beta-helix repeat protein
MALPCKADPNITWSGTVTLDSNFIVPVGTVLNIEPGTTVRMSNGVTITIYGQLLADGNEAKPILFTRYPSGNRWKQIRFAGAADSRFVNCIFEYADSAGAHQDYYVPGPRRYLYHEAIVVLASHVDFEKCVFQKLPTTGGEGDAIAILSDDANYPGNTSANIRGCRFLDIGQGIHTRYSYVLVEDCYFQHKNGDNDDVDLWGESTPPCLIRNNLFDVPEDDDRINPTKCSAIIIGNVIKGSSDHGIVLRDKSSPVVMNNVISNCSSGGIAVENSCTALLVNNTIFDCGRGLRLFDLGRWDSPYYLTPGGGTATVINCVIWDCSQTITLADSSNTQIPDRGSHITVSYSDIEGGRASVSVSGTYSTVVWGQGNINSDPFFANATQKDFHLKSQAGRWDPNSQNWVPDAVTSPCIDTGDPNDPNYSDWTAELWPNGRRINMGAYGGTPEASMSLSGIGNVADLDNNNIVNLRDFSGFADAWQNEQILLHEDFDRKGKVDCNDLSIFVDNWLWTP